MAAHTIAITKDMLTGESVFADPGSQLAFDMQVFDQVRIATKGFYLGWSKLSSSGETSLDLTSIPQDPEELFQDFAAHLLKVSERIISDKEVTK